MLNRDRSIQVVLLFIPRRLKISDTVLLVRHTRRCTSQATGSYLVSSLPQRPELVSTFHIISDLGFYLFPLESDLLTLTESSAFTVCAPRNIPHAHTPAAQPTHYKSVLPHPQDLYVDRDPSPLYNVARSLMDVQAVFGPIPKIVGKGHCAQVSSLQPFPPPVQSRASVWVTLILVYT